MSTIRRVTLRDSIQQALRNQIFSGAIPPGQWTKLDDIAHGLGVSITPVREAVAILADERLVELQPRRGIRSLGLQLDDMEDVLSVYGYAAGMMAERAARSITENDLDKLQDLIKQMDEEADPDRLEALNWEFHKIINRAGNAQRLETILRHLARSIPRHQFAMIPEWGRAAQTMHRELFSALLAKDGKRARRTMEEHVLSGGKLLSDHLKREGASHSDNSVTANSSAKSRPTPRAKTKLKRAR